MFGTKTLRELELEQEIAQLKIQLYALVYKATFFPPEKYLARPFDAEEIQLGGKAPHSLRHYASIDSKITADLGVEVMATGVGQDDCPWVSYYISGGEFIDLSRSSDSRYILAEMHERFLGGLAAMKRAKH